MSKDWPLTPLGEVLKERQEIPSSEDLVSGRVRIVSKIGFKEGKIELRDEGNTRTKMILIHPGDLVVSGINAAKGAIAIYGEENGGPAAATIHYGSYIPNKKKVDIRYLWWLLRSQTFRDILLQHVPGGIKTELKAKRLLPVPVPLPSVDDQQRIVGKIDELSRRVVASQVLFDETNKEIFLLIDSELRKVLLNAKFKKDWECGVISQFAEINPSRKGDINLAYDQKVSFVPMSTVNETAGAITKVEVRPFYEVSKGYTWFKEGDVIFARITPCMQNGKSAIARNLENGHGFGSTEFHVLRPGPKISAEWLHLLVRHRDFRDDAASHFKGTAGQQRVPQSFLEQKEIVVPPIDEQKRIVDFFDSLRLKLSSIRSLRSESSVEFNALLPSILDKAFKGDL